MNFIAACNETPKFQGVSSRTDGAPAPGLCVQQAPDTQDSGAGCNRAGHQELTSSDQSPHSEWEKSHQDLCDSSMAGQAQPAPCAPNSCPGNPCGCGQVPDHHCSWSLGLNPRTQSPHLRALSLLPGEDIAMARAAIRMTPSNCDSGWCPVPLRVPQVNFLENEAVGVWSTYSLRQF